MSARQLDEGYDVRGIRKPLPQVKPGMATLRQLQHEEKVAKLNIDYHMQRQDLSQPSEYRMNKNGQRICKFYVRGLCRKGKSCPLKHEKDDELIVCKHWVRDLCSKGEDCEFIHVYDQERMADCQFWEDNKQCMRDPCDFRHINPEDRIVECPWYNRGFCKRGPKCKRKHIRREMCYNFLEGFCPLGARCSLRHPGWDIDAKAVQTQAIERRNIGNRRVTDRNSDLGAIPFGLTKTHRSYR